ncbi:MAG TPA: hypothetical protein PLA27_09915 [Anaerolineales bacterium]|jgi:hypothetical protein|nr:hypothetical protein [Anaerolineales bacterium]HQX16724.1 hypothetical protein [Anaerolineales bacterium]
MNSENNSPLDSNNSDGKPKWLTPKVYETDAERKRDFWIGVGIFFALNIVLTLCQWGVGAGALTVSPTNGSSDFVSSTLFTILTWVFLLLPWVINIGLIIYFAFTRNQVALGMVAGFGIALAIVICLGVIFVAWCFITLGAGSY